MNIRRKTFDEIRDKEFEDVYYNKLDEIDIENADIQASYTAMENFLQSDRLQWIFEEAMVSKDDWVIELGEKFKFGECRIENIESLL